MEEFTKAYFRCKNAGWKPRDQHNFFCAAIELLKAGLDVNGPSDVDPFEEGVDTVFEHIMQLLCGCQNWKQYLRILVEKHNAQPSAVSLNLEITDNHGRNLQYLIDHGADVNDAAGLSFTPLELAYRYGQPKSLQILLENGAAIESISHLDYSPSSNKTDIYEILAQYTGGKALKAAE